MSSNAPNADIMASESPSNTGMSVVYEPEEPASAIVDIVFVHGLQGHPGGTWTNTKVGKGVRGVPTLPTSEGTTSFNNKNPKRNSLGLVIKLFRRRSPKPDHDVASSSSSIKAADDDAVPVDSTTPFTRHSTGVSTSSSAVAGRSSVFWPADLLPQTCPRARILVFGYDTKITNYGAASTNKNSIYSHAKDLLFAISRAVELPGGGPGRPMIFVAHSLGGIVVKEMLARSSTSTKPNLKRIVESTFAVVFLGTPHRGSPNFAAAGDRARSFVSFLGAETSPTMLHALGLRTTDLERAQEAFSALWLKYNFRVKTFQEGLGLTGINIAGLGSKVVPDYSSSLGDEREHAETIQANHREMCRFYGPDDPGYRQVSGELGSIYLSIGNLQEEGGTAPGNAPMLCLSAGNGALQLNPRAMTAPSQASAPMSVNSLDLRGAGSKPFTEAEKTYLQALWFPNMNSRRRNLAHPTDGTCNWLFENDEFKKWVTWNPKTFKSLKSKVVLQIHGAPGSGKSVLMKEAYRRTLQQCAQSGCLIAAFFFNGKGVALEHSANGMLRSLLYQLLPQVRGYLAETTLQFTDMERGVVDGHPLEDQPPTSLSTQQLEDTLRSLLVRLMRGKRAFLFIDAIDEANSSERISILAFLNAIPPSTSLNLLISNRNFPLVMFRKCRQIDVDRHCGSDIATYVEWRLSLGIAIQEPRWRQLRDAIVRKSGSIFLWAVLAVDGVVAKWEQGAGLKALISHLDILPPELFDLFSILFGDLPDETASLTLRLFQWAILSARPLQLQEWHHVMAFIGPQPPSSLRAWRDSDDFTQTDEHLERKIRALSKGLLEVAVDTEEPDYSIATTKSTSEFAGAGSFMMNPGETRIVQVIHESVHQFFKSNRGFDQLVTPLEAPQGKLSRKQIAEWRNNPLNSLDVKTSVSDGHIAIMATCLDYLNISELDALVAARNKASEHEATNVPVDRPSLNAPYIAWNWLEGGAEQEVPGERGGSLLKHSGDLGSYQSPIGPEGVDLLSWISGIVDNGDHEQPQLPSPPPHPPTTTRRSSHNSIVSQMLEDYPALLSYATDEFFTHARQVCDHEDIEWALLKLDTVLSRLADEETWNRWLALREELHLVHPLDGQSCKSFRRYLKDVDRRFARIWNTMRVTTQRPITPTDSSSGSELHSCAPHGVNMGFIPPWVPEPMSPHRGRRRKGDDEHERKSPTEAFHPNHLRKRSSAQSVRLQRSLTESPTPHDLRKHSSVKSFRSAASSRSQRMSLR